GQGASRSGLYCGEFFRDPHRTRRHAALYPERAPHDALSRRRYDLPRRAKIREFQPVQHHGYGDVEIRDALEQRRERLPDRRRPPGTPRIRRQQRADDADFLAAYHSRRQRRQNRQAGADYRSEYTYYVGWLRIQQRDPDSETTIQCTRQV